MANTPTAPASVASRMTDNEILKLAENHTRIDSSSLPKFVIDRCRQSAAVLRDYVRLRKLANAVRSKVSKCNMPGSYEELKYEGELPHTSKILKSVEDIKRLLAEAEKGEVNK